MSRSAITISVRPVVVSHAVIASIAEGWLFCSYHWLANSGSFGMVACGYRR